MAKEKKINKAKQITALETKDAMKRMQKQKDINVKFLTHEFNGVHVDIQLFNRYLNQLSMNANPLSPITEVIDGQENPTGFEFQQLDDFKRIKEFFKLARIKKLLPRKVGDFQYIPVKFLSEDGEILEQSVMNRSDDKPFFVKVGMLVKRYEEDFIEKFRLFLISFPQDNEQDLSDIVDFLLKI